MDCVPRFRREGAGENPFFWRRLRTAGVGIVAQLLLLLALAQAPSAAEAPPRAGMADDAWRIRFLDAAIVDGPMVTLGEVAVPVGNIPPGKWEELARRSLWPSPPEGGRAVNMTRPKLQEAVMRTMQDLAPYCLFPGGMAIQRGGKLIGKEGVQAMISRGMAPLLASLRGEALLKDFRLPQYVFMEHAGQELILEPLHKIAPGRIGLRLLVREMDGSVKQRLTGSVFLDCWVEAPCSTVILNRDDLLDHNKVTFKRVNLANVRGEPWDGLGGPWRVVRPVAPDQIIYRNDIAYLPTVRKGAAVTLIYEGKNIRLSARAEALADGMAGESIPVRNLQSRKEIYGVVRDAVTIMITTMP
ncbi:MAG: flagellar basal body P-ring formation chaperone FlgA [Desulfovibrio sp.]|jgi:flagella basal body P-ring formation protein FlgA|nr:flagellar basal body P-ring formation chaperone FlgA [Desulfovibrio sp.]